jgi:hypothetical protein
MSANQVLALLMIFGCCYAIAKNWRKIVVFLGALTMTAVCFGVYSIVETVLSDLGPAGVHGDRTQAPARSAGPLSE